MNGKIIGQGRDFNYPGCNISYCERKEVNNKEKSFKYCMVLLVEH